MPYKSHKFKMLQVGESNILHFKPGINDIDFLKLDYREQFLRGTNVLLMYIFHMNFMNR